MHSVFRSATSLRETKRQETARRIMRAAGRLTLEHGIDGWTMDDLAAEAQTSRRTLFNYFPAKIDAVLGPMPVIPEKAVEVFRTGGPTGELLPDALTLARGILETESVDPEVFRLHRALLCDSPAFLKLLHERFETLCAGFVEDLEAREGPGFGESRARLLVRLMVVCFDTAMDEITEHEDQRPVTEVFDEAVAQARDLLT